MPSLTTSFLKNRWVRIGTGGAIGYTLICLFIYSIQKELLYHPERFPREDQINFAKQFHGKEYFDSHGEFCGWMVGPDNPTKTVVVFHGNAAPAVVRQYLSNPFRSNPLSESWQILLFEYPGFGPREGTPDETTLVEKAILAVDSISGPLVLVGESLGTGVAAHVASQRADRVDGVLLITPFNNMTTTAEFHYPLLPIPLILSERYPSDELLRHYHGKVGLMIAEKDEVIPAWIGEKLYDSIQSPKQKWIIPGVGHEGISHNPQTLWWQEAIQFLAEPTPS